MATFLDNAYSLVHLDNTADQPSQQDLKTQLEKGNDDTKVETMKRILTIMLNGDPMPNLLMHIIRFVMPCMFPFTCCVCPRSYGLTATSDGRGTLARSVEAIVERPGELGA